MVSHPYTIKVYHIVNIHAKLLLLIDEVSNDERVPYFPAMNEVLVRHVYTYNGNLSG